MSAAKHTPEPWVAHSVSPSWKLRPTPEPKAYITSGPRDVPGNRVVASVFSVDGAPEYINASRVVSCVNACKGIADPETTVPDLIKHLKKLHQECFHVSGLCRPTQRTWNDVDDALDKLDTPQ